MSTRPTTTIGSIRLVDGRGTVRMEDVFDTGIEDLWSAVTEPDRLARWLAHVEGDLRVDGEIRLRFTSSWEGTGRIEVCDAPHHLRVRTSEGRGDETVIEARLTVEAEGTRLVIEDSGIDPDELPAHGAGWQAHVDDLAHHLADPAYTATQEGWHARWAEVRSSYDEQTPPS